MTDTQDFDARARTLSEVGCGCTEDESETCVHLKSSVCRRPQSHIASALRDVAAKEFERGRASRDEEIARMRAAHAKWMADRPVAPHPVDALNRLSSSLHRDAEDFEVTATRMLELTRPDSVGRREERGTIIRWFTQTLRDVDARAFEEGRADKEEDLDCVVAVGRTEAKKAINWQRWAELHRSELDEFRSQIATLERENAEPRCRCAEAEKLEGLAMRSLKELTAVLEKCSAERNELREANTRLRERACRDIDAIAELRAKWMAEPSRQEVEEACDAWDDACADRMLAAIIAFIKLRSQSTVTPYKGELKPMNFIGAAEENAK